MLPADLATGHVMIDAQHESILREAAVLRQAVDDADGLPRPFVVGEFVRFLRDHLVAHFGLEEELMQATAYPEEWRHRDRHKAFFDTFTHHRAKLERAVTAENVRGLAGVVEAWVREHVLEEDAELARWVREHRAA